MYVISSNENVCVCVCVCVCVRVWFFKWLLDLVYVLVNCNNPETHIKGPEPHLETRRSQRCEVNNHVAYYRQYTCFYPNLNCLQLITQI